MNRYLSILLLFIIFNSFIYGSNKEYDKKSPDTFSQEMESMSSNFSQEVNTFYTYNINKTDYIGNFHNFKFGTSLGMHNYFLRINMSIMSSEDNLVFDKNEFETQNLKGIGVDLELVKYFELNSTLKLFVSSSISYIMFNGRSILNDKSFIEGIDNSYYIISPTIGIGIDNFDIILSYSHSLNNQKIFNHISNSYNLQYFGIGVRFRRFVKTIF